MHKFICIKIKCTLHHGGNLAFMILFLPNAIEGGHGLLELLLLLAANRDEKKSSKSGTTTSESEGHKAKVIIFSVKFLCLPNENFVPTRQHLFI